MRKFKLMVSAVVAFLVMSCGGVSVESNEVFGDVPGIYKAIGDNTKQEIENAKGADNPEDIGKAKEAAEKFEAEMLEKLPAAIAEIGGRDVPFSGESDADFKGESVKVAVPEEGESTLALRIKVSAAREMPVGEYAMDCANGARALRDTRLYFVFLGEGDKFIDLGSINPFSDQASESRFTPKKSAGATFAAGELLTEEGSLVYVRCNQFDFTKFAKIAFVSEADYMNLRRQAYGF